jgi:hypothetical protein
MEQFCEQPESKDIINPSACCDEMIRDALDFIRSMSDNLRAHKKRIHPVILRLTAVDIQRITTL